VEDSRRYGDTTLSFLRPSEGDGPATGTP